MKVAIVTGSTRGIGRGIADALHAQGYTVLYSGTRTQPPEDLPPNRDYCACNIADRAQREALLHHVLQRYGRLDVLVNNAGIAPRVRRDLLECTEESFDEVLNVNLRGTFFLSQAAAREMIALKNANLANYQPRIINIGSMSAYTVSTNRAEYCISKAGLSMVTQLFADRLSEYQIPVFEIRPGIIQTDMTQVVHQKYEALIQSGLTPIRRFGMPQDVANMVLAACSTWLDFTSGQVLNCDGGFHLRRL